MDRRIGPDGRAKLNPPLGREWPHYIKRFIQNISEINGLQGQLHRTGFDPADIQDFIDQVEEVTTGTSDMAGTGAGIFEKAAPMARMLGPETFRHQDLDLFSEQFLALVAEDFFGLRIYQHNRAFAVDDDNGIGSGFEQRFEFLVGLAALGNVLRRSNDSNDLAGIA